MTWILPKQLHTSAFVADTKALDLDSEEFSQICEKSLTWRGKDSLSRTWLQRWKRESWMQHLCSRTLKPSHTTSFLDKWTSYLEDSRANPSVLLESVKQLKTPDTSFLTSLEESKPVNLELCFSKTSKEFSPAKQSTESQFSSMSSEHWKKWITEQRQEYSQRKKSAHLTRESESSSLELDMNWGTPAANDANKTPHCEVNSNQAGLTRSVGRAEANWPTPTIAEVSGGMRLDQIKSGKWHNIQLREKIALMEEEKEKNWVSPTASQAEKPQGPNSQQKGLQSQVRKDAVETQERNWATPSTMDHLNVVRKPEERPEKANKGGCKNLREKVMQPQNWATPEAQNHTGYQTKNGQVFPRLGSQVKNWPTASARDWKDTAGMSTERDGKALGRVDQLPRAVYHHDGLQDQANLNTTGKNPESWPTPRANKVHPEITEQNREHLANRKKANLEEDIAGHCGKATGKLNPNWVEHLMGLPVGWTDLGSWETASFH